MKGYQGRIDIACLVAGHKLKKKPEAAPSADLLSAMTAWTSATAHLN